MERHPEILRLLVVFFCLLFLGCLNPRIPGAASVESSPLIGEWVIVEQTTTPLMIIPLCRPIQKGTTVKFTQTTFEVYLNASGNTCDTYAYKASNNHLTFIKADMLFLCTYELMPNSLKLTSTNFFIPAESENPGIKKEIIATNQSVIITLKRR
ncbi:hypothetical protein [Hymenobacter fastidiosus]|uniref:hypothetical protein n=1 Tax=Hymenobacter fastidiosus TaxID=486264 RepID=UPI0031F06C17